MRNRPLLKLWILGLLLYVSGVTGFSSSGPLAEETRPTNAPPKQVVVNADDDDEPIQVPGLLGRYSSAGETVLRQETDIAFVWGANSPDQRLRAGPFQAQWTGKLLVRLPGKYRIHAHVQGQVDVTLGNQPVLKGECAQAKWISGEPVSFEYGEHPLLVNYQSAVAESRLKLYWSSDSIALEPIPAVALFMHEAHPELELEARGRLQFTAHRCNRCHRQEHDPLSPPGPDLTHVTVGLRDGWLEKWLTARSDSVQHGSMPEFGFTADEVQAIEAFLTSQSQPVKLGTIPFKPERRDELAAAGKVLFHSLGCLACHGHGVQGQTFQLGGGDLSRIGEKRTFEWLQQWLADPAKLNADHRMPIFALKRDGKTDELLQLAMYLSQLGTSLDKQPGDIRRPLPTAEHVERGKQLVVAARCAACHRVTGVTANLDGVSSLNGPISNRSASCLQPESDRAHWRPAYPSAERGAIQAYLATRVKPLAPEGPDERGRRLLAWNNCLLCHPRDGGTGLGPNAALAGETVEALKGQGPTLVPPSLNAVGDKMLDAALLKAVAGDFSVSRLPWLRIRMPKFRHSDADQKALAAHFTHHDRIESPPDEILAPPPIPTGNSRFPALASGHTLLGSQGFSCIACHIFGKFVPRNTALGTRGSDLRMIGQRMRREFFLRWTRSPIRIVPNMEMPSFERPVEGILDGRIDSQLAALWESLHDENSSRPLEISAVQQNLTVKPGAPARIVRDVFSVTQSGQEIHIPRSFAVGFSNQHNILIDLDTFRLKEWWLGDFARQRTEGKSWFWDLGGTRVSTQLGRRPDLALLRGIENVATLIEPVSQFGVQGTLKEYGAADAGVRISYHLQFPVATADRPVVVSVTEIVAPIEPLKSDVQTSASGASGWRRSFTVTGVPDGLVPVFIRPEIGASESGLTIAPAENTVHPWHLQNIALTNGQVGQIQVSELKREAGKSASGTLTYLAEKLPVSREAPQPIALNAEQAAIHTVPGYEAIRLPLPRSIMPTALTWTGNGTLALASLKGHVYLARDSDQDGLEDQLYVVEEGLAAPYGLIADEDGIGLLVAHKPEVLRLRDTDGDGRADLRQVVATGWGYNDNYHDWTCGIVRDSKGRLYVGLGSDYTQPKRPVEQQRWRGKILRIERSGSIEPIASGLRYPTGLALTTDDELFVTDNQGEQNTCNELNHIIPGERYGVPSMEDLRTMGKASSPGTSQRPAIQIPHPWTRSINGIFFLPRDARLAGGAPHPFAGQGVGCEYDTRYLIRFSLQKVGDTFQGAVYPFSQDQVTPETPNFEGTLCGGVSPKGDLYIGCIHDSGWLGGLNVGTLYRLRQAGAIPLGIREIQARADGFSIEFTEAVNPTASIDAKNFSISAYTREWQGNYATPDSQRHQVGIKSIVVGEDQRSVRLHTDKLREGFVYEVSCGKIGPVASDNLWPATGHYTVNRVPK